MWFPMVTFDGDTSPETSSRMSRQRRRDTKAELLVRRILHARGWRYRVDEPLPLGGVRRRADMLFSRRRVAVFVDGCFWHSCPDHGTSPRSNAAWWAAKLAANRERDQDTDRRLSELGWTVLRIWEHEEPLEAAKAIETVLRASVPTTARTRSGDASGTSGRSSSVLDS